MGNARGGSSPSTRTGYIIDIPEVPLTYYRTVPRSWREPARFGTTTPSGKPPPMNIIPCDGLYVALNPPFPGTAGGSETPLDRLPARTTGSTGH